METALNFDFTMNYDQSYPGDELWIEFPTFNKQFDVFQVDLGMNFFESYKAMTCAVDKDVIPNIVNIENKVVNGLGLLECFLHRGQNFGKVQPAVLKIPLTVPLKSGDRVIFWVAVAINPKISGLATGF